MRMSKTFKVRWQAERIHEALETVVLNTHLRALVEAPLIRIEGCLVLAPLVRQATGPAAFQDRTGYEAFINKVHVEDFVDDLNTAGHGSLRELILQGVKAAVLLSKRLENEGKFCVLLSLDPDFPSLTLRFFERRDGQSWGLQDPDEYPLEEILMINIGS